MTPVQTGELTREINVGAPPETVFPYFVEAERMVRWMGTEAEIDARPGGAYRILVAGEHLARGEFVEVDPPHRVVFTWGWDGAGGEAMNVPPGSSTVEVTLTAEGDGTKVVLVHRDLPEASVAAHEHGWDHYLGRLSIAGSGGEAGPDRGPGGG